MAICLLLVTASEELGISRSLVYRLVAKFRTAAAGFANKSGVLARQLNSRESGLSTIYLQSTLVVVNAGRTDTAPSTCLYVPSIGLTVGGDAVYNGIHPYLGETDTQSRLKWISTLDKLEALKSKAVVAGHKVPENDDDPRIIGETRQYLRDFDRLNEATANARELYDAMLDLYPDRVNPGSLWGAANTAKKKA